MTQGFPTGPRVSRRVRLTALLLGLSLLALGTHAVVLSLPWIGRTFPGFMVLDNRVVASVGLFHWSGSGVEGLKQSQVIGVNGRSVATAQEMYDAVYAIEPGTPVVYELARGGERRLVSVAAQRFGARDWLILNGSFLWNGAVYLVAGLIVWALRPESPIARPFLSLGLAFALLLFPAVELYRPSIYFRVHVIGETWLWAAAFHLVLAFPYSHAWHRFWWVPYALAGVVLAIYQTYLYEPQVYSLVVLFNYTMIGLSAVTFFVRLLWESARRQTELVRQRVRILLLGTLAGFAVPGAAIAVPALLGGDVSMNLPSALNFLFAIALAYAIVKQDLFDIDAMVKRGAYYTLLTGAVGAAYVGAVVLFNLVLRAGAITESPAFPIVFTLAVLLFFNPLRSRLQALVDRVFFRTRYDGAQVLAEAGADIGAALRREDIARLVCQAVDGAIPNEGSSLWVGGTEDEVLAEVGGTRTVPTTLMPLLATGRMLTSFDAAEVYADEAEHEAVRRALGVMGAEVAEPLVHRTELVGVLTVGPKRSGLFYTAGDAEFLQALCYQATNSLVKARTYEELAALNATLEQRVRDRTQELEHSNRDLAATLRELKNAEVQLVQSEKMASLGRLVAGIAHEINNPVSFISTSVPPLKRRLSTAAEDASPPTRRALRQAEELIDMMARGAERTATIVKDLRTFSRLQEATRKDTNLNEGLEVSLRLLESRWRDRITVHRDFGDLPPVTCDASQVNQVFMNLLTNACDAIAGDGNLWLTTVRDGNEVVVTIRDDGPGISADDLAHIFEPFFTTKDVGKGTGLGLSISHGIVEAHGGRLEAESPSGGGTTFRVILPLRRDTGALDSAAGGR